MDAPLTSDQLAALAALSTPTVCNAIETFNVRLRNEGYMDGSIINRTPQLAPMVGYAVTVRMRTDKPPVKGFTYSDRNDWWDAIVELPHPRIIVIQDMDRIQGAGSVAGEIHAAIFKALGCVGIVTNGAVRDLDELEAMEMHTYSGGIVPSHAYAHIIDIGVPVEVGNMMIENGDLLHGDRHGIVNIPSEITPDIHVMALKILARERTVTNLCASPEFSIEKLRRLVTQQYGDSLEGRN
ncbi:MAG: RraA family protein [Pseudomonadota bacterium]|nr:RraA family protein [Pseudomonadota bacterium]MDE3038725.1 RraA family protein [Pseudomonadota bacterium]